MDEENPRTFRTRAWTITKNFDATLTKLLKPIVDGNTFDLKREVVDTRRPLFEVAGYGAVVTSAFEYFKARATHVDEREAHAFVLYLLCLGG